MDRVIRNGRGWRLGWNPQAPKYQGLVGGEDWGVELTAAEFEDFCRLLGQLAETMQQMASELMDEEKITCEAESNLVWIEVRGFPDAYDVHCILSTERGCEFCWPPEVVPELILATKTIKVF
ncbi:DUF1818 family protein [Geitlerinema splendidum]|nr:DUF1818 family protein [Geitlerinema splendidum]